MFINIVAFIYLGFVAAISETCDQKFDGKSTIPQDCSACGMRILKPEKVVQGGIHTAPGTYPWLVSLRSRKDSNNCGGAIISDSFILTAAHCVKSPTSEELNYHHKVYFQTSSPEILSKGYAIEKIIVHPRYSIFPSKTTDVILAQYDVALVKLKRKIECNEYRNSVCLPSPDFKLYCNDTSIIAGHGLADLHYDKQIHTGYIKHIDFEECIKAIPEAARIRNHSLCGGHTKQTVCYGDSGSPLVHEIDNKFYVIGVTSSETDTRCAPSSPSIYMNVVKFLDWINKHTK